MQPAPSLSKRVKGYEREQGEDPVPDAGDQQRPAICGVAGWRDLLSFKFLGLAGWRRSERLLAPPGPLRWLSALEIEVQLHQKRLRVLVAEPAVVPVVGHVHVPVGPRIEVQAVHHAALFLPRILVGPAHLRRHS